MIARGEPIVGGGAGTGLSAKCEEAGGIDLIVIYNSGRYRMAGRGSLAGLMPYGDANAIVVEMAAEVLPVVKHTPVLAGVNGTDPFRDMDVFLDEMKALGFAGVQNFPTVGLIDGMFRANLEETGMSYALEVEMIAKARAKDLLTTPYVFNEAEAEAMARAGADIIVCHMGLTTGGAIGAQTALKLADCPGPDRRLGGGGAAPSSRTFIVLAHGGPIAEPADADFIMKNTQQLPRLLRRLLDGAAAGGAGADGAGSTIQGDRPTQLNSGARRSAGGKEMSGFLIGQLILWLIVAIIVIVVVVYVVNWLYHRSSKEVVVRPHRLPRRAGGDRRRRLRAAVHPRLHAGQHERAADADHPRRSRTR